MFPSRKSASILLCVLSCPVFLLYSDNVLIGVNTKVDTVNYLAFSSNCTLPTDAPPSLSKKKKKLKSKPIWVVSFPGSGAELFRQLVTRLTNQPTVDAGNTQSCKRGEAVACKTHWPTIHSKGMFPDPSKRPRQQHENVILLIRNPANAIPSWYNQIYESLTHAEFHSQQAPEKNWIRWSRKSQWHQIEFRFKHWRDLILYWLESSHYKVDLFVPYERLVDPSTGPQLLAQVTDTLIRSKVSTVISSAAAAAAANDDDTNVNNATATMECMWKETVQQQATMKRSRHKYTPSYTKDQQQNMLALMDDFIHTVAYREDLVKILQEYSREIENNLVID